jgi:hypothetical protein
MDRRGFLSAIIAAGVAPAFVRVGSLMRLPAPAHGGLIFHPDSFSLEAPSIKSPLGNRLIAPDVIAREALEILAPMLDFVLEVSPANYPTISILDSAISKHLQARSAHGGRLRYG